MTILGIIITLPIILLALGLGALVTPFTAFLGPRYAMSYSFNYILSMVALATIIILEVMAIPGLFKRQQKSWRFLFYSILVNIVYGILGGDFVMMIITTLISLYILFQVKEYYK